MGVKRVDFPLCALERLVVKIPQGSVKPRLFHLYVFTYKIDLGLALENEEEFRDGE